MACSRPLTKILARQLKVTRMSHAECQAYCRNIHGPLPTKYNLDKPNQSFSQRTSSSHPHLLKDGELQPGVNVSEFQSRRQALVHAIRHKNMSEEKHMVIIPAASQLYMTEKIPYPYRQSSDLLYLTGCTEPGSTLVLESNSDGQSKEVLFLSGKNPSEEMWDGCRLPANQETALLFDVDEVLPKTELKNYLKKAIGYRDRSVVWYETTEELPPPCNSVRHIIDSFLKEESITNLVSPRNILHGLKVVKSKAEIRLMTEACRIGSQAFASTIASKSGCAGKGPPFLQENVIAAKMDLECRALGAQQLAYPPVVAAGDRANTIHYINNNQLAFHGELILMDAGCEYFGYNSDITRTWPVSGSFTSHQKILYEAVLNVQQQLISLLQERPSLDELFVAMRHFIAEELHRLGLVASSTSRNSMLQAALILCPHHVSHFLGLDVHDTNTIPHDKPLQPGMVITVEPGIYVKGCNLMVPKEFRGLGIRIEDNVLITESEPVVLTAHCPKTVHELEALMASTPCQ